MRGVARVSPRRKVPAMSLPFAVNSSLENLPVYQPGRPIEEVARELGMEFDAVIKLASNENPLGPSPKAVEAMEQAVRLVHLYPDGNAFYLKNHLADTLGVETGNLIFGNGSNEIIEFIAHAMLGRGDSILVSEYCFAIYPIVAKMMGADVITVPAKDYGHDLPAMLAAITPNTKAVFVANPNNPTGTLAPREDVIRLVNDVPDDVLLVMDEAYIEFLSQPVDLLPLIRRGDKPNLLLMRTFSKIFGLAGLRIGYGIGAPEFVGSLEKIRQPFNANAVAQAGALAALDDFDHLANTRANNEAGLQFLNTEFHRLGLDYIPSAANFVTVKVGDGMKVFNDLQAKGVITRPMAGYRMPDWIRVSVGTPEENTRCVFAMRDVLGKS